MKIALGTTNKVKSNNVTVVECKEQSTTVNTKDRFYSAGLSIKNEVVQNMIFGYCWCDNCNGNRNIKKIFNKVVCVSCNYIVSYKG